MRLHRPLWDLGHSLLPIHSRRLRRRLDALACAQLHKSLDGQPPRLLELREWQPRAVRHALRHIEMAHHQRRAAELPHRLAQPLFGQRRAARRLEHRIRRRGGGAAAAIRNCHRERLAHVTAERHVDQRAPGTLIGERALELPLQCRVLRAPHQVAHRHTFELRCVLKLQRHLLLLLPTTTTAAISVHAPQRAPGVGRRRAEGNAVTGAQLDQWPHAHGVLARWRHHRARAHAAVRW